MGGAMPLPLWVVALVLAAVAPLVARALASVFERRSHERSARVLAQLAQLGMRARQPLQEDKDA
jgi:hypothetical protein